MYTHIDKMLKTAGFLIKKKQLRPRIIQTFIIFVKISVFMKSQPSAKTRLITVTNLSKSFNQISRNNLSIGDECFLIFYSSVCSYVFPIQKKVLNRMK